MQVAMATHVADNLAIAAKAFQAQLEVCSKWLPGNMRTRYRCFPGKHKLEHRTVASEVGELGVLQGLATMVRFPADPWHAEFAQQTK